LEQQIEAINQSVLDSHTPFNEVKTQIAKTGGLVPLAAADLVSVEAIPARIFDMLSKTQVKLAARVEQSCQSRSMELGTQSLSVFFPFRGHFSTHDWPRHTTSIQSRSWRLRSRNHISTRLRCAPFGTSLIAERPEDCGDAFRRVARSGSVEFDSASGTKSRRVEVFQVRTGTLTADDERKIAYHVRAKRGNLLFAKSWLLVEGGERVLDSSGGGAPA
jgi:putative ATP-dependent endonuclease of the OLD family